MGSVNNVSEKKTVHSSNDNATQRVPEAEQKGFWSVAFVCAGFCICMSGLYTGSAIAFGMNFRDAIIATLVGNIILSVYGGLIGAAGAREGVSSSILARHSFGREGSKVVGILLAVVMAGWYAVQVGCFGSTMSALFPEGGFITSQYVAAAWGGTIFGYLIANTFIIMSGYLITATTGESDLPVAFLAMGLGVAALLILILAQWTTNDNNLYTASLGLSNCLPFPKKKIVIATGLLATLTGTLGLADYFSTWLNVLGVALPPVAGVIICDYYLIRHRHYEYGPGTKYCKVNIWAFAGMIIGMIVGFTVNAGIASINSLVVSVVAYLILMKIFSKSGQGIIGEEIEEEEIRE